MNRLNVHGMKRTFVFALCVLFATSSATGQKQALQTKYTGKVYEALRDGVKAPKPVSGPQERTPDWIDKDLRVWVSFVVTPDGSVANIKLLKRSRSDFNDFAVGLVSGWRFEPGTKDGTPVAVRLEAEVRSHH